MQAYKTRLVIKEPGQIILSNLPFKQGEHVEVLVLSQDPTEACAKQLEDLLKETQGLPQVRKITEHDIAEEISAYRSEK